MKKRFSFLNDNGIRKFQTFLNNAKAGGTDPVPHEILSDPDYITQLHENIELDLSESTFDSLYQITDYLVDKFKPLNRSSIDHNPGAWTWLSVFFFDSLCPVDPSHGVRNPTRNDHYIQDIFLRTRARHRLRTPYLLVRDYGERMKFMFSRAPSVRGELTEQLTSRQAYLSYPGVMLAASNLYSAENGMARSGSAGSGGGSARRYMAVLKQLELTYELGRIDEVDLLGLLPQEFDRFKIPSE